MTNTKYGASALLVDRSGSMASMLDAAQDSINEFISAQVATATDQNIRVTVRLDQFDHEHDNVFPSTDADQCPKYVLKPRGMTALYDSLGRSVTELGQELSAMPENERPGKVVFVIVTDGHENASREWTSKLIQELLERQRTEFGWEFLFLGANQDAVLAARDLGISEGSALRFNTSRTGTKSTMDSAARYVAQSYAGGQSVFTEEDRKAAMEED